MKKTTLQWVLGALLCTSALPAAAECPVTLTTDTSNPVFYAIKNVRKSMYVQYQPTNSAAQKLREVASTAKGEAGSAFYFVANATAPAIDGWTAVNIYADNHEPLASISDYNGNFSATAEAWYIKDVLIDATSTAGKQGYAIARGNNGWNDYGSSYVCSYSWNDNGSGWLFEEVESATALPHLIDATVAAGNAIKDDSHLSESLSGTWTAAVSAVSETAGQTTSNYKTLLNTYAAMLSDSQNGAAIDAIKSDGDKLAAMTDLFTSDAIAAWNAAKKSHTTLSDDDAAAISAAYVALSHGIKSYYVTFTSAHTGNKKMGTANSTTINATGNDLHTAFELVPVDGGFKILNLYENKYLVQPRAIYTGLSLTSDIDAASVYALDASGDVDGYPMGIKDTNTFNATYAYIHNDANYNRLVAWESGAKSSWAVSIIGEDDAATENLEGALHYAESSGSALHQYGPADKAAFAAAHAAAKALGSDAGAADKRTAATNLWNQLANTTFNLPIEGHFYRFKGQTSGKYMSFAEGNTRNPMVQDGGELNTTVFYYTNGKLVSLATGKILGSYIGNANTSGNWTCKMDVDATAAGTVTFRESPGLAGYYNISPADDGNNKRYIYEKNANVDCGSFNATSDGDGYRWIIEEVTWLPIAVDTELGYTTFYSPVELNRTTGYSVDRFKAYTIKINGEKAEKTAISGNIPANTPVLLEYTTGAEVKNGCVFLEVMYPDAEAALADEAVATVNHLAGNFLLSAKEEGKTYYTVGTANDKAAFVRHDGDNIFGAHLAVADDEAKESYEIAEPTPTAIVGVEAAEGDAQVIYDLQGRRVAKAAKGLYIINGVKTLVR